MERIKTILIITLVMLISTWMKAFGQVAPWDIATIESLIDCHKKIQGFERSAVKELGVIGSEHVVSTNFAMKYSEAKQIIHQRMADFNSYLILASSLARLLSDIENIIEQSAEFTKQVANKVSGNPLLLDLYTKTCAEVGNEIKRLYTDAAYFTGYQTNVLKATMKEKNDILIAIKYRVSRIQSMLTNAFFTIRCMTPGKIKVLSATDLAADNSRIMKKIIKEWNANCQ